MTGAIRTVSLASYEPAAGDRILRPCGVCGGEVTSVTGPEVFALSDAGVHSGWCVTREHQPGCEAAPLFTNQEPV